MKVTPLRTAVAGLTLSASALIGLAVHEGYRGEAYIPVPGDRLTIGFGDATRVKLGDKTNPVKALQRLGEHADRMQSEMRACLGDIELAQWEWDAFVSFSYNLGTKTFCESNIPLYLKRKPPDYVAACNEIRRYVYAQGKVWAGLVKRREEEYRRCLGRS